MIRLDIFRSEGLTKMNACNNAQRSILGGKNPIVGMFGGDYDTSHLTSINQL